MSKPFVASAGLEKAKYHNFDAIRGLAAIIVLMFHTAVKARRPDLFPVAFLAVDLFFMLSGFVIAQAYADKLRRGMTLRSFLAVRGRRLYPLFFLGQALGCGVFTTAALMGVSGYTLGPILMAFAYGLLILPFPVRNIGNVPAILPLNYPSWSLFFEIAINVAYALALPWLSRRVLWSLLSIGVVGLTVAGLHWGHLAVGPTVKTFSGGVPRVLVSFAAGVLIYEYRPKRITISNTVSLALFASTLILLLIGNRAWWHDIPVVCLAFPVLVYLAARYQSDGVIARTSAWLGRVSYAIYILHMPMLYFIAIFVHPHVSEPYLVSGLWIATVVGVIAAGHFIDRFYDVRLQRVLGGGLRPKQPAVDQAVSF
jgi:peptidoglycan/LPS O-acetylase OafA/YrhL